MSSETIYTIEQFIKAGSNTLLSYNNLALLENTDNNGPLVVYNLLNDYLNDISKTNAVVTAVFKDIDVMRYAYKPKLLCNDVYGSGELYFVILALNNMCDVKQFNLSNKKIKMIKREFMEQIMSYIYNVENSNIVDNRNRLNGV
jgi:hypothetical protein